jgi:hypothetical protein
MIGLGWNQISRDLHRFHLAGRLPVLGTQACHLVSQRSTDSAPLPLRTMTRRSDRSNTKYSIPSPFFDPNQFSVHPSGRWTMSAPVKMMNSPPAAILPKNPDIRAILPNDCPIINEPGNKFRNVPRCDLFKRGLDSWGAKSSGARPSEELLHAIGKGDDSRDDSQESVDIIRIRLKKGFDHRSQELSPLVHATREGPRIPLPRY